jgi:Na+-transporting NADH:ubiquinone oxidoreductase subunit NqrA
VGANEGLAYLGRYHIQVSILPEDRERKLIGYLNAWRKNALCVSRIFIEMDRRKIR